MPSVLSHRAMLVMVAGAALGAAVPRHADAQTNYPEIEPNNTRAQAWANGFFTLTAGDSVSGVSTGGVVTGAGTANPDYFVIRTAPLSAGIYRHRLVLSSSTPGHTVTIRGVNQIAAPAGPWPGPVGMPGPGETTAQVAAIAGQARINQWYGFGRQEMFYYRIVGAAATTGEYTAVLETAPVQVADLGVFAAGMLAISTFDQGHVTDTDLWVYDADLRPIHGYGNDGGTLVGGAPSNNLTSSFLRREFSAGVYYLAITNFNLANDQGTPCDDMSLNDTMMDFPDIVLCSTAASPLNVSFAVTDSAGTRPFQATKEEAFDIVWARFTVTGIIATGACCFENGTCEALTAFGCSAQGGTYRGDNTDCQTANCPQPGACCFDDGTCQVLSEAQCAIAGGVFAGGGVDCASANCPQPGACCFNDFTCQVLSEAQCAAAEGMFLGALTLCTECPPPPIGACCLPDLSCEVLSAIECHAAAGAYMGDGSPCGECPSRHAYNGAPVAIPDGTGSATCGLPAVLDITVTDTSLVLGVDAAVRIVHTWQGDVKINLRHVESGRVATLIDRPGVGPTSTFGFEADDFGTAARHFRLRPEAAKQYGLPYIQNPGIAQVSGSWRPVGNLGVFEGIAAAGTWRLEVFDCASFFTGTVHGFVLWLNTEDGCYFNCDESTVEPILNIDDFVCFVNEFAIGQSLPPEEQVGHYANCDRSTVPPVLNIDDFTCFINGFAVGCP